MSVKVVTQFLGGTHTGGFHLKSRLSFKQIVLSEHDKGAVQAGEDAVTGVGTGEDLVPEALVIK